jgi:hypothetical protein
MPAPRATGPGQIKTSADGTSLDAGTQIVKIFDGFLMDSAGFGRFPTRAKNPPSAASSRCPA